MTKFEEAFPVNTTKNVKSLPVRCRFGVGAAYQPRSGVAPNAPPYTAIKLAFPSRSYKTRTVVDPFRL